LGALKVISPFFDAVVSDMAPQTTGIREVDQERSLELARQALACAEELLKADGNFLVKIFEGPETGSLVKRMREIFVHVHRLKPAGSRPASPEIYLLGLHKRTGPGQGKRRRPPEHREP
jgi:23S rRNA (uridine2552-2'-O)-methyltransferase